MFGGLGLTSLVLKPIDIQIVNGQPTQVSLTTDSDIYLNSVPNTPNTFLAALKNLDTGALVGQVEFTVPSSVNRIAILGGIGDNLIQVDPSVQSAFSCTAAGAQYPDGRLRQRRAGRRFGHQHPGRGLAPSGGNNGNDSLYGGNIPAVYQSLINTFGAGSTTPPSSGAPTSNALMTWLRQQPAGHNYLIAGSGNSQLYAGNDGDLLIGGNAQIQERSVRPVSLTGLGAAATCWKAATAPPTT